MGRTWLITGASRGFGRLWAEAALGRGDRVVATARNVESLNDLQADHGNLVLCLPLDVRDRDATSRAVAGAVEAFGGIDIVVNNAGYGLFCPVEDVPEQAAWDILETNFMGSLRVVQHVLPVFRRQQHGHIVQISSIAGLVSFPGMGLYNATKWAVEGLAEAVALEVERFGIKVTIVEPGPHLTDWIGSSAVRPERNAAYPAHEEYMGREWPRFVPADPREAVEPMLRLVDSTDPPRRLLLGEGLFELVKDTYQARIAELAG